MAAIPAQSIDQILNRRIESLTVQEDHRGYLGLSQMGHSCDRYLWLILHDVYRGRHSVRTGRIFERGHWEEPRVIEDLRRVGLEVDSEQDTVKLLGGHVQGHFDGIVSGVPNLGENKAILEIKAVNNKSFNTFSKKPLEEASPSYYAQVQLYMRYSNLKHALFVVVNKDNEMRYFSIIDYDEAEADKLEDRVFRIFAYDSIPKKCGGPDWYVCKMCSMYPFCHESERVNISCRSCNNVTLGLDGLSCKKGVTQDDLTIQIGCRDSWESCIRGEY